MPLAPKEPLPDEKSDGPLPTPHDPSRIRVAGLYPFRTANGLSGNIYVHQPRWASDKPLAVELIDLIEECAEQALPLRCLIFDNEKYGGRPPFTMFFTKGESRKELPQETQSSPEDAPSPDPPPPPLATAPSARGSSRPARRTAPRRA